MFSIHAMETVCDVYGDVEYTRKAPSEFADHYTLMDGDYEVSTDENLWALVVSADQDIIEVKYFDEPSDYVHRCGFVSSLTGSMAIHDRLCDPNKTPISAREN